MELVKIFSVKLNKLRLKPDVSTVEEVSNHQLIKPGANHCQNVELVSTEMQMEFVLLARLIMLSHLMDSAVTLSLVDQIRERLLLVYVLLVKHALRFHLMA